MPTRVLVPHVTLHPLTRMLLDTWHHGVDVIYHPIVREQGYAELLCEMWTWPETTIIVEQDNGITEHTILRFLDCDQPWCGNAYPIGFQPLMALGCTKFSAHVKAMQPDLMEKAFTQSRDWRQLDGRIDGALQQLGHTQHRHHPDIQHFHEYVP